MKIKRLGDMAFLVEVAEEPSHEAGKRVLDLAKHLEQRAIPDVREIVPGLIALGVYLGGNEKLEESQAHLHEALASWEPSGTGGDSKTRVREIPVQYGGWAGPDLERVAQAVGMSIEEVVKRHSERTYQVAALGFAPGFPYLTGLDPELACPRLPNPRISVPAGSVGIGGDQTGVYPQASPGGWNLIGCTDQKLFDSTADDPSWLRAGDEVKFVPVDRIAAAEIAPAPKVELVGADEEHVEVLSGGVQSTVQDLGRWGHQRLGVSVGGAVNRRAAAIANVLVGNRPDSAVLEWVLRGPRLRFSADRLVAVTGIPVEGRPLGRPFLVRAGETLEIAGSAPGAWGYLAISGGINVPLTLGGSGTHLAAGFGGGYGRALLEGDRLPLGGPLAVSATDGWRIDPVWVGASWMDPLPIRVVRGPECEALGEAGWQQFLSGLYTISPDSNRMGIRLGGDPITMARRPEMVSQPVAEGVVQLPPQGLPVVLMADRQTLGGYPRIAAVISADMAPLAQTPVGGKIRFREVSFEEAETLRLAEGRDFNLMTTALRSRLELA